MTVSPGNLTDADRQFLARPRIGLLTVAPRSDEWPAPVPVWFEAVDDGIQLFTSRGSRKARRIVTTPRASLVAANEVGEPEYWVAVTGTAAVEADGAQELSMRLAEHYWDLSDPALAAVDGGWRSDPDLVRIVIQADHIARYAD